MEAEKAIEKVDKDGSESDTSFKRKLKEAIKHKRNQETKKIHETSEFMIGNS